MKEIMKSTPNNLETFNIMLLLAHELHEKNGKHYEVQICWSEECVKLYAKEEDK